MEINIKIKNMPQVMAALKQSPVIVGKHINKAIKESIFDIERKAKPLTPVDTGRLRGSYDTRFGTLYGEVTPTAEYAIYVHEGTRYMTGRPFLSKGVKQAMSQINKNFEKGLEGALNEIARKAR